MAKKRLGELLIEKGIINEEQLASALAYQRQWGHRLGYALMAKGIISEGQLCNALSEELSIPQVDLTRVRPNPEALRILTGPFCESHELFPFAVDEFKGRRRLTCAMADPLNIAAVDEIEFTSGCKVRSVLAPLSQIHSAIRRYYLGARTVIKKVPVAPPEPVKKKKDGEMVLLRASGQEEKVDTRAYMSDQALRQRKKEQESVIVLDEVTRSTSMEEIERQKKILAAKRRQTPPPRAPQPRRREIKKPVTEQQPAYMNSINTQDHERLDKLERMFWGLVRVLAKKGFITKEEFLSALGDNN